jgi:hypothetical protein
MAERERVYLDHLTSAADLVTTHEETRAGFVALALERNRQATPLVEEARALQDAARRAVTPLDLFDVPGIETGILIAAGISEKALPRLRHDDRAEAINNLIKNHLEPAGDKFVEELIFRFMLNRGETLSESMRNIGKVLAQRRLTRAVISALNVAGVPYRWRAKPASWTDMSDDDSEIERTLQGLTWGTGPRSRTLLYNLNVPVVGGAVDICLFAAGPQLVIQSGYAEYDMFLVLGELKGAADPASGERPFGLSGALNRYRLAFEDTRHMPMLLFIGAAIDEYTAMEVWEQLETERLANAANLSRHEHLNAISRWLVML